MLTVAPPSFSVDDLFLNFQDKIQDYIQRRTGDCDTVNDLTSQTSQSGRGDLGWQRAALIHVGVALSYRAQRDH
jgi:hypothetical protein